MYHVEGGQGKPSKKVTLNGSQSARDQWPPIPLPSARCTGAALYSIFKHMATPTRRRNSTWPLETDILASKREGKLFNEDGSRWWLYISFCNGRHTALLQPALTFVLSLSHNTLRRLCVLTLYFGFSAFFSGKTFACVYVFAAWMLKSSHGVKKPAWLAMSTGKCWEKFSPVPAGHIVPGLAAVCGLLWNDVLYQHWMSQALHIYGIIGLPTDGMERNGSLVSFPPYLDGILPGILHAGSRMDQCRWRCPVRMLLHVGAQPLIGG